LVDVLNTLVYVLFDLGLERKMLLKVKCICWVHKTAVTTRLSCVLISCPQTLKPADLNTKIQIQLELKSKSYNYGQGQTLYLLWITLSVRKTRDTCFLFLASESLSQTEYTGATTLKCCHSGGLPGCHLQDAPK